MTSSQGPTTPQRRMGRKMNIAILGIRGSSLDEKERDKAFEKEFGKQGKEIEELAFKKFHHNKRSKYF